MNEWFKDWFASDEYLSVYRHRNEEDALRLFQLIRKNINLLPDMSVLDICCGACRHSIHFALMDCRVFSFDLSLNLLKAGKKKAALNGVEINLFNADLRNIGLKKQFDLVINLFTSFGYFESDEENFMLFRDAYSLLKKNGCLVFDYFNTENLKKRIVPESVDHFEDKTVIQKRYIESGRIKKDIKITSENGTSKYTESVKLYTPEEIMSAMESAGFCVSSVYGDYSGTPLDIEISPRLIIIARK